MSILLIQDSTQATLPALWSPVCRRCSPLRRYRRQSSVTADIADPLTPWPNAENALSRRAEQGRVSPSASRSQTGQPSRSRITRYPLVLPTGAYCAVAGVGKPNEQTTSYVRQLAERPGSSRRCPTLRCTIKTHWQGMPGGRHDEWPVSHARRRQHRPTDGGGHCTLRRGQDEARAPERRGAGAGRAAGTSAVSNCRFTPAAGDGSGW
jgi:hypothetical protein